MRGAGQSALVSRWMRPGFTRQMGFGEEDMEPRSLLGKLAERIHGNYTATLWGSLELG